MSGGGKPAALLPKAELHVHIEGTLEPELAFQLARRNGVSLPFSDVGDLRRQYDFTDLQSFLNLYYTTMMVLRTERDFADLADAYLSRAAVAGVRHAEIFFDPQAHAGRGVPMATVVEGLWSSIVASRERFGISTGLILCFLRDQSAEAAMATLSAALPYTDRLLGVGLDSAELGHPPSKFAEVFSRARAEGLRCVAHAGEEGPPSYIWEALDLLRVARIDHGVRCMEDAALVERLRTEAVPLTVCPLSNVRLHVVGSMRDHRLPEMLRAGLLVTVNSDDPAYFGGYIDDNFSVVQRELDLPERDVRTLAENSFRAAFLAPEAREAYLHEVAQHFATPQRAEPAPRLTPPGASPRRPPPP